MDERQQRVLEALIDKRPDLAQMYRAALTMLSDAPEQGGERTRIAFICHSMREVMNRVLGVMGVRASLRVKPTSTDLVRALPEVYANHPELVLEGEGPSVALPHDVALLFAELIKTATQEKRRVRDDVASLLTDDGNSRHLVVGRWMMSQKFFVKWAHLSDEQSQVSELPSDDLIRSHVHVFDELFDGVITAFFTRRQSIDDLLAEINAVGDEVPNG